MTWGLSVRSCAPGPARKVEGRPADAGAPFRTCQVQKSGYFFFAAFFFVAFFFAAFFLAAIEDHLLRIYCLGCVLVLPEFLERGVDCTRCSSTILHICTRCARIG